MRISRLSEETGVSVPTIKFYLREGLLHGGRLTSATQADYDETHVRRLALIRALLGPAGLSLAAAKALLTVLDSPPPAFHDLLGFAHSAVPRTQGDTDEESRAQADRLAERAGWSSCSGENRAGLASALAGLRAADFPLDDGALMEYADSMTEVARREVARVPTESAEAAVRYVALGTVLAEPVLLAMRRLAQERASEQLFGTGSASG